MKKVFVILLAVAVIGALILGGCAKTTPSTTTTTTQTQTSTSTSTTTKTTTTTTDSSTQGIEDWPCQNRSECRYGIESKKWYELFAKLINEQGGWKIGADTYDVEMIIYDSAE